jgi:hypothetical protein
VLRLDSRAKAAAPLEMTRNLLRRDQVLYVVEHLHAFTKHRFGFPSPAQLNEPLDPELLIAAADLSAIPRASTEPGIVALEHGHGAPVAQKRKRR